MKSISDLMKQASRMQEQMQEMQARLATIEIEGVAGAGLVRVVLNGKGEMRRIAVDPSLLAASEKEVLEDLVVAAHNDAKAKAEAKMAEEMGRMAGGLGLPPGLKLPF